MKTEYDKQANAVYLKITNEKVVKTIEIDKNTMLDLDENENAVGIEILNASRILKQDNLPSFLKSYF